MAFSVSLQLRTLQKQGLIVFHSLISGGNISAYISEGQLQARFDLVGAEQAFHLETFNRGGLADGGWHQIGLTLEGGRASLRSDLEEVAIQIGQGIRTGSFYQIGGGGGEESE